jgi:hypothetical protein
MADTAEAARKVQYGSSSTELQWRFCDVARERSLQSLEKGGANDYGTNRESLKSLGNPDSRN